MARLKAATSAALKVGSGCQSEVARASAQKLGGMGPSGAPGPGSSSIWYWGPSRTSVEASSACSMAKTSERQREPLGLSSPSGSSMACRPSGVRMGAETNAAMQGWRSGVGSGLMRRGRDGSLLRQALRCAPGFTRPQNPSAPAPLGISLVLPWLCSSLPKVGHRVGISGAGLWFPSLAQDKGEGRGGEGHPPASRTRYRACGAGQGILGDWRGILGPGRDSWSQAGV